MRKNGIIFVRFENDNERDDVIYGGIFYFDEKLIIVKLWISDIEFVKNKFISLSVS